MLEGVLCVCVYGVWGVLEGVLCVVCMVYGVCDVSHILVIVSTYVDPCLLTSKLNQSITTDCRTFWLCRPSPTASKAVLYECSWQTAWPKRPAISVMDCFSYVCVCSSNC